MWPRLEPHLSPQDFIHTTTKSWFLKQQRSKIQQNQSHSRVMRLSSCYVTRIWVEHNTKAFRSHAIQLVNERAWYSVTKATTAVCLTVSLANRQCRINHWVKEAADEGPPILQRPPNQKYLQVPTPLRQWRQLHRTKSKDDVWCVLHAEPSIGNFSPNTSILLPPDTVLKPTSHWRVFFRKCMKGASK